MDATCMQCEFCSVGFAAAEAAELEAETGEAAIPWVNLEPTLDETFEEGIRRLQDRETWKIWQWPMSDKLFYTPEEYKCAADVHSC
jgi:hypothetical protein